MIAITAITKKHARNLIFCIRPAGRIASPSACGAPAARYSNTPFSTACLRYLFISFFSLLPLSLAFAQDTPTAGAAVDMQTINFSPLPGEGVEIEFSLSAPPPQPISFTIDNPARIVLDFPNTHLELAQKTQSIGLGVARSLDAIEAKERSRVVLNLARLVPYQTRIDGNSVFLTLEGGETALAGAPETSMASDNRQSLQDIDFRRGENGAGQVVVSLSDPDIAVDSREQDGSIVVDFENSSLPEGLQRRLDVTDFATPVSTVSTFPLGNDVRMVVTPTGDYEHFAYQSGSQFTVEVRPVVKQPPPLAGRETVGYDGERLSLNFQDIQVRAVLQLIADFTGLNLVASDTVQGSLTLRLQNVPWDQALDIILENKGLDMRRVGNVIMVAPKEEIAARQKLELEAQKQTQELAPLRSELVRVNYAKATDLALLLSAEGNSFLSDRGNVTVDERTNTLLIQDTADKLTEIRELIATLDIPIRQVLIESRIVLANDDFSKNLGVRFGATGVRERSGGLVTSSGGIGGTDTIVGDALDNLQNTGQPFPVGIGSPADRLNVNLPVISPAGSIAFAILGSNFLLDLELSALQAEGRGEVISNPRVVTSNQREAVIEQGTEIPYLEASSSGAATITFRDAVLSLRVLPQITPDDRILMDLVVKQDAIGENILLLGSAVPTIDTREVSTQVLVKNGETVVLGGVYEEETRNESDRVPFFGDLPYVGALFRQTRQANNKSELLIFVTPKIIKDSLSLGNR